jgi:hypothetical protein
MKKIAAILLGLSLALGATIAFGQEPPPKTEKSKKKTTGKQEKNQKRKAEQPKAQ